MVWHLGSFSAGVTQLLWLRSQYPPWRFPLQLQVVVVVVVVVGFRKNEDLGTSGRRSLRCGRYVHNVVNKPPKAMPNSNRRVRNMSIGGNYFLRGNAVIISCISISIEFMFVATPSSVNRRLSLSFHAL